MEIRNIQGIVLNINNNYEKFTIIKILTKENIAYLKAKGFKNFSSKNRSNVLIGSLVDFEILTKYSHNNNYLLKKATIIKLFDYANEINKIYLQKHLFLLDSINEKSKLFYEHYVDFLDLYDGINNSWIITYLLNLYIQDKGIKLQTNYCCICYKNRMLYSFDINEGGILCFQHSKQDSLIDLSLIKSIYNLGISFDKYIKNMQSKENSRIFDILKEHLINN